MQIFLGSFSSMHMPHQMEYVNYLVTISTEPQASWSLWRNKVNPCDLTLFPHHQPVRELCKIWPLTLWSLPSPGCQMLSQHLREAQDFLGHNQPHLGEGSGTPLQYSCLENPMDGGAWWAAVHGVTTEWLPFHFSLSRIGEGNGNPLQCSCLENPRDRAA